jgi:hypothetical protein
MKPEDFAKQFFDVWQQSASQLMRDPAYSQKMLEMMQQYGQLWQESQQSHTAHTTDDHETPDNRPAADDGADADPTVELADRLAYSELRLAQLEQQVEHLERRLHTLSTAGKPAAGES